MAMVGEQRRPAAVRRRTRRTKAIAVLLVVAVATLVTWDVVDGRGFGQLDPGEAQVEARVIDSTDNRVIVRYRHPETQQDLESTAIVWAVDRPLAGETVAAVVSLNDPLAVQLLGDRFGPARNMGSYLFGLGVALLLWVRAGSWQRRAERLARSDGPATLLVGSLSTRETRFGRVKTVLNLYPLDAPPGGEAVCSIPVLTTDGFGHGRLFPVEVRGVARPRGRVVARSGDTVFWPEGRALRTSIAPRPHGEARSPSRPPQMAGAPSSHRSRPTDWAAVAALVGLALAPVVVVGTAVFTTEASKAEAAFRSTAERKVGESVDPCSCTSAILRLDDGRMVEVPLPNGRSVEQGIHYPVWVSLGENPTAILAMTPYARSEPISWAVALSLGIAALSAWRLRVRGRHTSVERTGPWHRFSDARVVAGHLVLVDDIGHEVGYVPIHARRGASVHDEQLCAIVVAGELDPYTPVAAWRENGTGLSTIDLLQPPTTGPSLDLETSAASAGTASGEVSVALHGTGFWNRSWLVVAGGAVRLELRTYFGRRALEVPMHSVSFVIGPPALEVDSDPRVWIRGGWTDPHFATGGLRSPFTCALLFSRRVRLPRARWWWLFSWATPSFPPPGARATWSRRGAWVDALHLQIADAPAAVAALANTGREPVTDFEAWARQHREVIDDPDELERRTALLRRRQVGVRLLGAAQVLALGAAFGMIWLDADVSLVLAAIAAALIAMTVHSVAVMRLQRWSGE